MAQLDNSLVVPPFGEVNVFEEQGGPRVLATILMKPQVENAQTGLAIDCSKSMAPNFGAHLPKMFRGPDSNVVQRVVRVLGEYLANFDSDGHTTIIYWACGTLGNEIVVVGDFDAAKARTSDFDEPKSMGNNTVLLPAVRYFAEERFRDAPWGVYVFITDGVIEDLEDVKTFSLKIGRELSEKKREFIKFVLIGLGPQVDEKQMEELDDLDYGGLKLPNGDDIDLWDHTLASSMRSPDEIFKEVVSKNTHVSGSATIVDSNGQPVKPIGRPSYGDGLPARIEFTMSPGAKSFTVTLAGGQSFTQPISA
jgi:hypothetical protein